MVSSSKFRICDLPDEVLCHILSFLPTKFAVGTSILSRRWRNLWLSLSSFDFDYGLLLHPGRSGIGSERRMIFTNFVNRVLLRTVVPHSKTFRLVCGKYFGTVVHTWISAAIKGNVQELVLGISRFKRLPRMLFTSNTLVSLKISAEVRSDVPLLVWLPSLKILHLKMWYYTDDIAFQRLLRGCPVLEEMLIKRDEYDVECKVTVSSPTLRSLTIVFNTESECDEAILMVNAPKLEYLNLSCIAARVYLLENLSFLVKAYVNVQVYNDDCSLDILRGITNVKFLSLTVGNSFFDEDCIPTFHTLTHLELDVCFESVWKLLGNFLGSLPNLEVLIAKECEFLSSSLPWHPPQSVPTCLVSHLKEIEIIGFRGLDFEVEAIAYLLENAKVLKMMEINSRSTGGLGKESPFWKKLSGLPRASKSCKLSLL